MALSSFILNVDFPPSHCAAPGPRCQTSTDCEGSLVNSILPEALLLRPICTLRNPGQFFPFTSLTLEPEALMSHLAERRKGRKASEMVAKNL